MNALSDNDFPVVRRLMAEWAAHGVSPTWSAWLAESRRALASSAGQPGAAEALAAFEAADRLLRSLQARAELSRSRPGTTDVTQQPPEAIDHQESARSL